MRYSDEKNMQNFKKVDMSSWDALKEHVYLRLINAKYLNKYGDDIAYSKCLDLSIVFSVQEKTNGVILSYILTNKDLKDLGVSIENVTEIALSNTLHDRKRRIMTFKESTLKNNPMFPIMTIPRGMTLGIGSETAQECGVIEDVDLENDNENILMLCNKHDTFGSSYMIISEILEEVFERFNNENFYIVPLSVHQVMCIRAGYVSHNGKKPFYEINDDLLDMVESFNDECNKSWKDILSYKVYYYFGDDGKKLFLIN